jgi:hypothetical protein
MNLDNVLIDSPSISIPYLLANLAKRFKCFAGHFKFVQRSVLMPLLETLISVCMLHAGHLSGIENMPVACLTEIHFGMILFALIISRIV